MNNLTRKTLKGLRKIFHPRELNGFKEGQRVVWLYHRRVIAGNIDEIRGNMVVVSLSTELYCNGDDLGKSIIDYRRWLTGEADDDEPDTPGS